MVVIVGRMQWFELEAFGNLASYLKSLSMVAADHRADAGKAASVSGICRECGNPGVVLADLPCVVCIPAAERRKAGALFPPRRRWLNTALTAGLFKYQSTTQNGRFGIASDWSD